MNEKVFQNAEITPFWIVVGTFENDQRPRYRPAPFEMIELNGSIYLQNVGTDIRELDGAQNDQATIADLQMRTGYGFLRPPRFVEDSAIGGADDDTILAVHCFRNI